MRACLVVALLIPSFAAAAIYEVQLDNVDSEDDIIDLEEREEISTETADILYEMIVNGVDLNSASRDELFDLPGLTYADVDAILQYRKDKGRIEDPTELVGAGTLTDQQLLLIAPFIRLDSGPIKFPVAGKFRLRSGTSSGDFLVPGGPMPPPAFLQGTFALPWNLSAGFIVNTTRLVPGSPYYDPLRGTLTVAPFGYRAALPVAYAQWKAGNRRVVVGSFTIGFAERLTLDTTRRRTPNGISITSVATTPRDLASYCKQSSSSGADVCNGGGNNYVLDDFSVRSNFRGIAGSIEDLEFGDNRKLSLFGFVSYQTRDLYQYEMFDRNVCEDPRDESDNCKAPQVFVGEDLSTDGRLKFTTLPGLYEELVGGAHVDFKPSDRYRIGLTGYGATTFFHGSPLRLEHQEWSRTPFGGPFGAIGLDGRAQFGKFGLFIEATRTFDSIVAGPDPVNQRSGGGGFGVEQRTLWSTKGHELELSLRYYDDKFLNPLGRPVASPDEFEGQSARNEVGARLNYFGKLGYDFELRFRTDIWTAPFASRAGPAGLANIYSLLRLDYEGYRLFAPAIWFDVRNKNLASSQHGTCASGLIIYVEGLEPFVCSGDSYRATARVDLRPFGRKLTGAIQASFVLKDDLRYKDRFMQGASASIEVRTQPTDFLQLKLRSRYLNEDISDSAYLEDSVWTYLQATYIAGRNLRFSLRYDLNVFLGQSVTTLARIPSPEHRVYLDLRAGF
jgi:hypothetical protein